MRPSVWFAKWRKGDGPGDEQEKQPSGRGGSRVLGRMKGLWRRSSSEDGQWDERESSALNQASPLSQGLF